MHTNKFLLFRFTSMILLLNRSSVSSGGNVEMSANGSHVDSVSYNDSTQEVMSYSSGDIEIQQTTNQMPVDNNHLGGTCFMFDMLPVIHAFPMIKCSPKSTDYVYTYCK